MNELVLTVEIQYDPDEIDEADLSFKVDQKLTSIYDIPGVTYIYSREA